MDISRGRPVLLWGLAIWKWWLHLHCPECLVVPFLSGPFPSKTTVSLNHGNFMPPSQDQQGAATYWAAKGGKGSDCKTDRVILKPQTSIFTMKSWNGHFRISLFWNMCVPVIKRREVKKRRKEGILFSPRAVLQKSSLPVLCQIVQIIHSF